MKHFSLFAIALFFIVGCTQMTDTGKKELDEVSKQNVELAENWIQALENEDIEALREMYSTELVSIGPQHDQEWPYDTLNSTAEWFQSVDSIKMEVIGILPQTVEEGDLAGDWVLVWSNITWYDVKAEKKVKIMWHSPMRIQEGKIVLEVAYWNQWDLFKQLGAELKWPEAKK